MLPPAAEVAGFRTVNTMNFFEKVKQVPPDPIFGLNLAFNSDPRESKVNLGAGIYKTADLKPLILHSIKEAERRLFKEEVNKNYLPIDGYIDYVEATKKLVFGELSNCIYGAQTVGGTAALRVGGAFLRLYDHCRIFISDPTWANHRRIFKHANFELGTYPYFDYKHHRFDFEGFCDALNHMPERSVVLLQGVCHNPTGCDPTQEQWQDICKLMQARQLFPFLDLAYQGFGTDPQKDAAAVRCFVKEGLQCAVAVSHSKNFGLYAERTGALFFVCQNIEQVKKVGSQVQMVIRGLYSNPPCHGARLVSMILHDDTLKQYWLRELANMRERILEMRRTLVALLKMKSNRFDFLADQLGMFSYIGLGCEAVEQLLIEYGIYLPKDGRINVAGLNQKNVTYVADAIISVTS